MSRIRVLVVDDSVVVRRLVVGALEGDRDIEVVGTAANGRIALDQVTRLRPHLVTMDIEMPEMDGLEAVQELRRRGDRFPIIMFSTLTERGAEATLDALAAGATDYVTKPTNVPDLRAALTDVAQQLLPRIKALVPHVLDADGGSSDRGTGSRGAGHDGGASPEAGRPVSALRTPLRPLSEATRRRARRTAELSGGTGPTPTSSALRGVTGPRSADAPVTAAARGVPGATARRPIALAHHADGAVRPVRAVVIGASTGGPEALTRLVASIARPLPVPVVVVQHMPPVFTRQLAQRLDRTGGSTVVEAVGGEELLPGHVYVAPGDHHLELERTARGARTRLTQDPPVNFCRPAVDTLFRTAVDVYGGDLLAVVLTGMGTDGRTGTGAVVAAGGTVVVQDEASSVVWGMPGAVAAAGLAHRVVPIDEMAATVVGLVQRGVDDAGSHADTHPAPTDTPASRTGALTPARGGAR